MISHDVPKRLSGHGFTPVRWHTGAEKARRPVTSFISTYENKVDRKGRVSVPAAYRASLANEQYQGVIGYPSLLEPTIEVLGRSTLEELNRRHLDRSLDGGDFERTLIGSSDGGVIEAIMAMASEMPFDGEGRIIIPARLADHAGIQDRATFVGRGTRFQIWAPERHAEHQATEIEALRARLARERAT